MKGLFLTSAVLAAGVGGVLTTGTAAAAAEAPAAAAPAAQAMTTQAAQPMKTVKCKEVAALATVRHRAPVHTRPSAASQVMWFAAKGRTFRIGGYCDNSLGNRWYCVAGCDFSDTPKGFWVFEEYFKA